MLPQQTTLSQAAVLVLQMAYASGRRSLRLDSYAMTELGLGRDEEDRAVEELRAADLLKEGALDDEVALTDEGRDAVDAFWPRGQLPAAGHQGLVIGSFDGQDELPVYRAVPVPDLQEVVPGTSVLARELAEQCLTCSAWKLFWPLNGEAEDRVLLRVEDGIGEVSEFLGGAVSGRKIRVGPGMWLSVDPNGRCTEMRRSVSDLVFLIAMRAA